MSSERIQHERELFERHLKQRAPGVNLQRLGAEYIDRDVQLHFDTWLARADTITKMLNCGTWDARSVSLECSIIEKERIMEIDIRSNQAEEVATIRFADNHEYLVVANGIVRGFSDVVEVVDIENDGGLRIFSEEHARNLIKALNKAIALGWFKE